jgi:hypothetical protein
VEAFRSRRGRSPLPESGASIVIAGSGPPRRRGLAQRLIQQIGVSPWYWFADAATPAEERTSPPVRISDQIKGETAASSSTTRTPPSTTRR